ncbi:MAG: family 10 glycosylhydrolase, partial [Candidatus Omnitrophota bacterium]
IVVKLGNTVFTKDQYLRVSSKNEQADATDKYYLRENQLFLEPGDPGVGEYILSIIDELLTRYPALAGIHLDYIRYPYAVPYLPDSRFNNYGISYGYGEKNIARFKQATGLDPLTMQETRDNCLLWDDWKREQITALARKITRHIKAKSEDLKVSCAVIPYPEQAYSVVFQDWPLWIKDGIIDYVVLMSYTKDNRLFETAVKSALAQREKGQVYVGIGAFLMKTEPKLLEKQCQLVGILEPDGIVFFSYDDLSGDGL